MPALILPSSNAIVLYSRNLSYLFRVEWYDNKATYVRRWKKYLGISGPIDERVIKEWTKMTDVFPVYVRGFFPCCHHGLRCQCHTRFSTRSRRCYNHLQRDDEYDISTGPFLHLTRPHKRLLFVSLAFAIVVVVVATIFKI